MAFDFKREMNKIEAPVISFENVSKAYQKGVSALKNVNLTINKGEFVFIVGDSGSGKSTMIKLMLKETVPTKGKVYVAGHSIARLRRTRVALYRRSIGVVFQDFRLLKDRNVFENVAFAQRVVGAGPIEIRHQVPKMLSLVGLSDKYKAYPDELSGGQQQRVALARALVNNPVLLLADEPTGNLDPKNSREIMRLLEDINKRGTTVVVVTHNNEIVDEMQKRVVKLQNGCIVRDEERGTYAVGHSRYSSADDEDDDLMWGQL
ncbi:MAG: cell division ATP-binding protein FtsE [Lachnospiraceae bacterium]|nr:cell division ATP-binding protein FtsE [Lachnospiraceae bacterium]